MAICQTSGSKRWTEILDHHVLVDDIPEVLPSMIFTFNTWVLEKLGDQTIMVDIVHYWPYFKSVKIKHFRYWLILHWWNVYLRFGRA